MDIQEYGNYQVRLISDLGGYVDNLMHMAAGISGEAGEVLDIVKKAFAYGKPIDRAHLIEELGDAIFLGSGLSKALVIFFTTSGKKLPINKKIKIAMASELRAQAP